MVDQEFKQQENLNNKIQKILGVKECEEIHKVLEEIQEAMGMDMNAIIELLGAASAGKLKKDTEKLIRFIVSSLKVDKKYLLKPKLKKALLKYSQAIQEFEVGRNRTVDKIRQYGDDIMELIGQQEMAQGKGATHSNVR